MQVGGFSFIRNQGTFSYLKGSASGFLACLDFSCLFNFPKIFVRGFCCGILRKEITNLGQDFYFIIGSLNSDVHLLGVLRSILESLIELSDKDYSNSIFGIWRLTFNKPQIVVHILCILRHWSNWRGIN